MFSEGHVKIAAPACSLRMYATPKFSFAEALRAPVMLCEGLISVDRERLRAQPGL
jgi:hypothetical protein